jgi:hypothetical protein
MEGAAQQELCSKLPAATGGSTGSDSKQAIGLSIPTTGKATDRIALAVTSPDKPAAVPELAAGGGAGTKRQRNDSETGVHTQPTQPQVAVNDAGAKKFMDICREHPKLPAEVRALLHSFLVAKRTEHTQAPQERLTSEGHVDIVLAAEQALDTKGRASLYQTILRLFYDGSGKFAMRRSKVRRPLPPQPPKQ